MKPDIATALIFSAQEISTRFLPLLKEEYDQSRLGSWGGVDAHSFATIRFCC